MTVQTTEAWPTVTVDVSPDGVHAPVTAGTLDAPKGTPRWWLKRLDEELTARRGVYRVFRDMVDGVHGLPQSEESAAKYVRMAGLSTTNLTGLAVEATSERMAVEGIRIGGEPDSDADAWRMWQASDFDAGSQEAITAALIYSRSYVSVAPPTGRGPLGQLPRLAYEDPRQVVVAYGPDGAGVAALKVFTDEWTGLEYGTLYFPDGIARLRVMDDPDQGIPGFGRSWGARVDLGRLEPVTGNPIGEIPFHELQNRPLGEINSEVDPLIVPQKLLNQTVFNMQAVAEWGAFRQKWATGLSVPRDPETGKPVAPYQANVAKLFVAEGEGAKFGDFGTSDLTPYVTFSQEIAAHIARLSRVPVTYFQTSVANLSADALALLVSALVKKCERRVLGYEPGFEGAVRQAFRILGDPRADVVETSVKWASMETRSVAQDADAAVKLTQGDNPVITPQTAQERYLGMSQTERDRDAAWRSENGATGNLLALLDGGEVPV